MSEPSGWPGPLPAPPGPEGPRRWGRKKSTVPAGPRLEWAAWTNRSIAGVDLRTGPVQECAILSEPAMWSQHGPTIWRTPRFEGRPHFYPVYRQGDHYSYSLLSLILNKGSLRLNPTVVNEVATRTYPYQSGAATLDLEIVRLGGPVSTTRRIRSPEEFARRVAAGMRTDASEIERLNPGYTNVLMCGGRDSLNMLLVPWRNPVLVVSAPPNHGLVRAFMDENGLSFDLVELNDSDPSLLDVEVLVNACRNDLAHCRWGPQLARLARELGGRLIFWKGQLGSPFMTAKWKYYCHERDRLAELTDRIVRVTGGRGKHRLRRWLDESSILQRRSLSACWDRGAMWQGAHVSILRQLTGALVASIYHGPAVREVREDVDLRLAVPYDVRPLIGECLRGSPPAYPSVNPAPGPSAIREGCSGVATFVEAVRRIGIPVLGA
jgi:hypothetical protein